MATKRKISPLRGLFAILISAVCAFCLVAAGFGVCLIPKTTDFLAHATSGNSSSPFSKDQLVEMAIVGRDYTIDTNDRAALIAEIRKINTEANTPYANADEDKLLAGNDVYVLTPDAISHLDDVFRVVQVAKVACLIGAAIMVIGLIIVRVRSGRRIFGHVMFWSGLLVLIGLLVLGAWALLDFYGFFSAFHSLFFADGTWTFSARSLLISMYPTGFWVGMAIVWVVVSVLASVIFIAIGRSAIRRARRKRKTEKEALAQAQAAQAAQGDQPEVHYGE